VIRTILAVLLFSSQALAWAPAAQVQRITNDASANKYDLLAAVALNASAATRTITVPVAQARLSTGDGYSRLIVGVDFTYAAATTVTLTPTCSLDGGTTYFSVTSTAITAGAGAVSLYVDTYTTSAASAKFSVGYDVGACTHFKIVFGGASAGAGDLVDIQAALTVGE
jgi:hypothetical protein